MVLVKCVCFLLGSCMFTLVNRWLAVLQMSKPDSRLLMPKFFPLYCASPLVVMQSAPHDPDS